MTTPTNYSFNIQVFAEPLGHPAPPEHRSIKVRIMELPVKNASRAEIIELGRVDDLTSEALDQIADSLKESLRAQVRRVVEGIALRIQSPGMAAIIDHMASQWTPAGIPKEYFSGPLGKSHEELPICSVCGLTQVKTPSGYVCANGHGGAPSKETTP